MALTIFAQLKQPKYLLAALGVALLFFDVSYYLMANFPGSQDRMCVMGVNLTPVNILFSMLMSLLIGVLVMGIWSMFAKRYGQGKVALSSMSGASFVVGAVTLFCPICALPAFSFLGLSLGVDFFSNYNLVLKLISFVLLFGSLYLVNKQLNEECERCAY